MEDLIKLMVERWYLPEAQVRSFIGSHFGENADLLTLEQIREITGILLQDVVLETASEK